MNNTLGIGNLGLRTKLRDAGFRNMDSLVKKDSKFTHYACQSVRKSTTGNAEHRDVTMETEERLGKLVLYSKYRYIVQRPMHLNTATLANLDTVEDWFNQLEDDPSEDTVPAFTDSANKKQWFESITSYLAIKKGKSSGVPLLYVVREHVNVPLPDQGIFRPSPSDEVMLRARHDGHFWVADNKAVWLLLRSKCHGTTAWNTIAGFQGASNGRGAFMALLGQFLGEDVRAVLLRRAEKLLENIRFDNRNRNFSFDKFIGKMREAFLDLGPDNQLTEQRKVNKLMQAFQVPGMSHLDAIVQSTPIYRNSFDSTVNLLASQLAQLRLKNGPGQSARNVGKLQTIDEDIPFDDDLDSSTKAKLTSEIKTLRKQVQREIKAAKAAKAKADRANHKKVQAHKFSKKNPTAYLSSAAWHNLTDEQKVAAREARKKAGIKSKQSRRVGMLLTNPGGSKVDPPDEEVAMKPPAKNGPTKPDEMDTTDDDSDSSDSEMATSDDESSSDDDSSVEGTQKDSRNKATVSAARVIPGVHASLLKAPKVRSLITTQRASTYHKRRPAPAPGTPKGDKKPAPSKSRKSKKGASRQRS